MIQLWCVHDEKPGHLSQLRGLVNALAARQALTAHWLSIHQRDSWPDRHWQRPALILTAGSRTHLTALKLRWRFGGKLIVLMKPSLPRCCFDLCVIPAHDGVKERKRVITTLGALNPVTPSITAEERLGLLLIGGPSRHYAWSDESVLKEIQQLQQATPDVQWTLTTSRRTPASFLSASQRLEGLQIVPFDQTDSDWLQQRYQQSGHIWVTEDSVSMIYESLSSGANTGILHVPRLRDNRISTGVDQLLADRRLAQLNSSGSLVKALQHLPLREAERVAQLLDERFFQVAS